MSLDLERTGASERRRLDSWKAIAAHLGRTVRTVQRWERDEGLPVHRHLHNKLGSVYAYADEVDRWWAQSHNIGPADEDTAARERMNPATGNAPVAAPANLALPEPTSVEPGVLETALSSRARRISPIVVAGTAAVLALFVAVGATWRTPLAEASRTATAAGAEAAAAELYRKGRAFWQQRTPRGFEEALHTFEAAIAANANDPRAHAGLADTYSLLEAFGLMPAAEALPRARAEAERALELAPRLGEAHASLALVLWEMHDTAGAIARMERALELDPGYATAHHWYALFLQQFLRRDEAIAEMRRAVALDPSQPVFWTELAGMLRFAKRFEEADAVLREARERHQGFPEIYVQLSDLAFERGETGQAVILLRRAVALGDNRPRIMAKLGCLEGTTGNADGALDALNLLRDMEARGQHVPDDAFAALLAWTGDLDGAFRHIQRGLDQRQEWVSGLLEAPGCFAPIRQDARWPVVAAALERASWLPSWSRVPPREVTRPDRPARGTHAGGF